MQRGKSIAVRLTDTMRRHLSEMLTDPFWYPVGAGEFRTAESLTKRGLLRAHREQWGTAYEITDAGREAVRDGR